MTTFDALIHAVVQGFTVFLPVSADAHQRLLQFFFNGLPGVSPELQAAISLGTLLSLLFFFRHDWFSILSSLLQVIIFRRKPMTLDERMPLFLMIATIPLAVAYKYGSPYLAGFEPTPTILAGILFAVGVLLWIADRWSRQTKHMMDWNWKDSLILGLVQIFSLIPGMGRQAPVLIAALFRNYSREAAAKFVFFSLLPILMAQTTFALGEAEVSAAASSGALSWLSFSLALVVSLLSGLLAIGGLMKSLRLKNFQGFVFYRTIIAVGTLVVFFAFR